MWQAFRNGENIELIYDNLCNLLSSKQFKFFINKSDARGCEYAFFGYFDLDCGEYRYILSLYDKGPHWHVYSLAGFTLSEYERKEGFKMLARLIRLLPDDLKDIVGSPIGSDDMLKMLRDADPYPLEFHFIDSAPNGGAFL